MIENTQLRLRAGDPHGFILEHGSGPFDAVFICKDFGSLNSWLLRLTTPLRIAETSYTYVAATARSSSTQPLTAIEKMGTVFADFALLQEYEIVENGRLLDGLTVGQHGFLGSMQLFMQK